MKKNFFKKLAATLALAMVVTSVAPAATASAAAGITMKNGSTASTVYASKGYTLKLGKSVKATWKSSNKAVATVGLNGAVLKPVKPGKVTITAKSKKTGKTYKKTYTVKQRATSVELGNDLSLAVGATAQLSAKLTPSTSTDVVRFFSDNKEVATVGMTGGKVTAKKAGEATITVYAKASKASSNKSAFTKVDTVKVAVGTFIESAVQDAVKKLAVTFNTDMKDAKAADFKIVRDDTNQEFAIKGISVDGKKVTVETYSDINDGATYTATYGDSSYKFVATDGKIATLAIGPATIVHDKETEMKLYAKDANGVIVKEMSYNDVDSEYDFKITTDKGYTTDDKLVLYNIGDTAKATATFHTYEYETNGDEKGAIKVEQTITATDASAITVSSQKYTLSKDGEPDWNNFTQNAKLAIDDDRYYVYAYLEDSNGDEVDNEDFTLESSNDDVLLVNDESTSSAMRASVRAVDKGTAYVLVRNEDDKVVTSLPITIVAERKEAAIVLSDTTVNISKAVDTSKSVNVDVKDQFGEKMDKPVYADIEVDCSYTNASGIDDDDVTEDAYYSISTGKVEFLSNVPVGTYKYKITVNDKFSKTVTVYVKDADLSSKNTAYKLVINDRTPDVVFNKDSENIDVEIKVAKLYKGVVGEYLDIKDFTLKRDGDKVTTGAGITASGDAIVLEALNIASDGTVSKALKGTYTIDIDALDGTKIVDANTTFTIIDTQAGMTVTVDKKKVDADTFEDAIKEALEFTYKGDDGEDDLGLSIIACKITGNKNATPNTSVREGRSYHVEEVTVLINIELDLDGDGSDETYSVPFTVKVGKTITIED